MSTRKEGEQYITHVEQRVYAVDDPLEEFITELRDAAEGLTNVKVSSSGSYDQSRDETSEWLEVTGDRPAIEEEIAEYELRVQRQEEERRHRAQRESDQRRAADERALARAQAAFPEMFK